LYADIKGDVVFSEDTVWLEYDEDLVFEIPDHELDLRSNTENPYPPHR